MGRTKDELLQEISSYELAEWRAFDAVEPIGDRRGDLQAALIACTFANCFLDKGQTPYKIQDFLFKWDEPEEQTVEEQLAVVRMLNRAFGGTDLTGEAHGEYAVQAADRAGA